MGLKVLNPAFNPSGGELLFLINKRHNPVYFRIEFSESFCLLADEDLCLSQEFSRLFFEKTELCLRRTLQPCRYAAELSGLVSCKVFL